MHNHLQSHHAGNQHWPDVECVEHIAIDRISGIALRFEQAHDVPYIGERMAPVRRNLKHAAMGVIFRISLDGIVFQENEIKHTGFLQMPTECHHKCLYAPEGDATQSECQ